MINERGYDDWSEVANAEGTDKGDGLHLHCYYYTKAVRVHLPVTRLMRCAIECDSIVIMTAE